MPDFNCEVVRDFSKEVGTVEMVSQEIGRVLLNLLSNAFDAVHDHNDGGEKIQPTGHISIEVHRRQVFKFRFKAIELADLSS